MPLSSDSARAAASRRGLEGFTASIRTLTSKTRAMFGFCAGTLIVVFPDQGLRSATSASRGTRYEQRAARSCAPARDRGEGLRWMRSRAHPVAPAEPALRGVQGSVGIPWGPLSRWGSRVWILRGRVRNLWCAACRRRGCPWDSPVFDHTCAPWLSNQLFSRSLRDLCIGPGAGGQTGLVHPVFFERGGQHVDVRVQVQMIEDLSTQNFGIQFHQVAVVDSHGPLGVEAGYLAHGDILVGREHLCAVASVAGPAVDL